MRTLTLVLAGFWTACGAADAVEAEVPPPPVVIDVDQQATPATSRVALGQIEARLAALTSEQRQQVADAVQTLTTHCPYSRASVQLAHALSMRVSATDPHTLPTPARAPWLAVAADLARHVALIETMSAGALARPGRDAYLHGEPFILSAQELHTHPDPLGATEGLVGETGRLVQHFDDETLQKLDHARAVLRPVTGEFDLLKWSLSGWAHGLDALQGTLGDHVAATEVARMREVTRTYLDAGC